MVVRIKQTPQMELKTLRDERQQRKQDLKEIEKEIVKLNVKIMNILKGMGKDEWTSDGLTAQIIRAKKTEYNWDDLRDDLDPDIWVKIVQEVPSEDALTREIAAGNVNPALVAKHSETKDREPYLKIDKAAAPKEEEV